MKTQCGRSQTSPQKATRTNVQAIILAGKVLYKLLCLNLSEERLGEHFLFIWSPTRHYGGRVKRNVLESSGLFCGFKLNGNYLQKNCGLPKKMNLKGLKPRKGPFGFKKQKAKKIVYGQCKLHFRWSSVVVNTCTSIRLEL